MNCPFCNALVAMRTPYAVAYKCGTKTESEESPDLTQSDLCKLRDPVDLMYRLFGPGIVITYKQKELIRQEMFRLREQP